MIVDQVVNNVELGLFHARMVSLLRSTFPQHAIDPILRQELTNGFQSVYYPPTANTVGVYYGGDNTRKIMYLDGVSNITQSTNLINGYSAYLGLQVISGPNVWIRENLMAYYNMTSGGHLATPEYLDLVGYSAGGAIAEAMAYDLRRRQSPLKIKVFTFGAPRPGGPWVRDGLSRMPVARYMTVDDPIPLVPPRLQDAPQLTVGLPVTVSLSWSNMVHPHGGIVINSDGTTEEAVLPPEASMAPGSSLAAWYFATQGAENNPHAMSRYIAALLAAVNRAETPREKKVELAAAEVREEENKREVNRERDRVVSAVAIQQRNQANTIVNQPVFVLFKPTRFGRIWAVVFGDIIVCQGVREDTCRHICRVGNDFLRSLPKQGVVDPIALLSQMEQFLGFASAPETEWLPKIQTNLNL